MLYIPVGASCSGKSTYGKKLFKDSEIVCPDDIRAALCDDELCQDENRAAFEIAHQILDIRCKRGLDTYFDATNLSRKSRKILVDIATRHAMITRVWLFPATNLMNLLEKNAVRDIPRPEWVIEKQFKAMEAAYPNLLEEFDLGWYGAMTQVEEQ